MTWRNKTDCDGKQFRYFHDYLLEYHFWKTAIAAAVAIIVIVFIGVHL